MNYMSKDNNDSLAKLSVILELNSQEYNAKDRQILKFTLTNNSNEKVNVLKWQTPLEGIKNDMFWVKRQDEVAVYLGKIVKRAAPKPHDYVTLDPKESISTDFDISEIYDITKSGTYTVEFDSNVLDLGTEEPKTLSKKLARTGKSRTQKLRSKVVQFELVEDRNAKQSKGIALAWTEQMSAVTEVSNFRSCSTDQQNQLNNALEAAKTMAKESQSALTTISQGNKRYTEWFGDFTVQNYDKIKNDYDKIVDALDSKPIIFNCSMQDCTDGVFAYVFPVRPYEIFLCGAFWAADLIGTDSRAGTLIHELSHFNVVAGTDDNVYGQTNCRQLARTDPLEAIANADSHEYFAENSPPLGM
jgi:peptidyl-Lys metalloendopeptidase